MNARERRLDVSLEQLSSAYVLDKKLHGERNVKGVLKNAVVIADRWFYSDAIYHEVLYGIPAQVTLEKHRVAGTLIPDLIIYVRLDPIKAYERILKRGKLTRHYERPTDLKLIVEGYERLFENNSQNSPPVLVVTNGNDINELSKKVQNILTSVNVDPSGEGMSC